MKLEMSRRTELALKALRSLVREKTPTKGPILAEALDTTASYLPHVLRPLVARGWVDSDRGPTGGYRLASNPEDISLLELIEAIEGPIDSNRCVLRGSPCPPRDLCALHEPWQRARKALMEELRDTTISDVISRMEAA